MDSGSLSSADMPPRWRGWRILSGALGTVLTLGLVAAAALALAPRFLPTILAHGLGGGVEVQALELQSVSPHRIELAVASLGTEQFGFAARQIAIRVDPWPFRVLGVEMDQAELSILPGPAGDPSGSRFAPALPFPLQIADLELRAATPWGEIFLPASLVAGPTLGGCFEAELGSAELSALLTSSANGDSTLSLFDASGAEMLRLDATIGTADPVPFRARLMPGALGDWLRQTRLLPVELESKVDPFVIDGTPIELTGALAHNGQVTAELRGSLVVQDARGAGERLFESARIESGAGYSIERTHAGWSGSGAAAIGLSANAGISLAAKDPEWRWDDEGLTVDLAQPELPTYGVAAETLEISAPEIAVDAAAGAIRLGGLRMTDSTVPLPPYDIGGRWSWRDGVIQASGNGGAGALPEMDWTLRSSSDGGRFEADVTGALAALMPSFRALLPPQAQRLEVRSGSLSGHYRLEWTESQQQTELVADIADVDADLEAMAIRGLGVQVRNSGRHLEPLRIDIRAPRLKLAAGAVAEDLSMRLRASRRRLDIDHARARLFDGDLSLRPASIDVGRDFALVADIDALSSERILGLFERPPVALTGAISGRLDIRYSQRDGLSAAARLHGIEPGTLRLRLGSDAAETGQVDQLALRALEDLRYDELSVDLDYGSDDAYLISARIVGSNPDVLDGHPFAFNPRIEGRLPALFKAFFITGDFNRAIIEGLRTR
ncbi:Dicarboxylate transport [Thioflavicoccus mobilis 8321]|uniref:Dicarboxylate transport n=2 Tax=Thioflavicoccus mobilis TaxID=80679 RepID=L0H277_9GAMM|nr:Dicarboxylate transport [Thioflavicoccus mobilis 8321]